MTTDKSRDGKWVHTRKIEINTLDLGDHQVLIEGNLADTRTSHSPSGEPEGSSVLVHHLTARLWVQGPDLTISAVEAEMPTIPREICPQALPAVQKLVGLKIITGFTQKVKDLIGDVKGCSHLTNLFLTLGPVAVQGYFAAYGRRPGVRSLDNPSISRVIDSCHVWRKDGPYVKSLAAATAREKKGA
ncbi:MAG: DUF2889 domain-containing protein [Proteobacteria bacterium]|nr:DUF2889 domain-containing protein [Pseudomonadota bacterium]